jgi:hypothetical protein
METSPLPLKDWKFGPLLRTLPWSRKGLAVTQGLGFSGLIRRTASFSHLKQHTRGCWGHILTCIEMCMWQGHSIDTFTFWPVDLGMCMFVTRPFHWHLTLWPADNTFTFWPVDREMKAIPLTLWPVDLGIFDLVGDLHFQSFTKSLEYSLARPFQRYHNSQ